MKIRAIQLTNFRQHANSTIEFGPGITGIIGPNGTGKTTILEAIAWALYGNEAARGRRDSIRFARADARAQVRVELDFELGNHRYRVARGLTSAELYLDGGEQPIANSITSVADILHRRIGMSRSEFFNTYFTGQKELTVMSSLGPTERAQFLSRVLGYERLKSAQELARDHRRNLIAELSGLRQVMPDADVVLRAVTEASARVEQSTRRRADARTARDGARKQVAEVTPKWEAAERDRAQRQQTAGDLRLAEAELSTRERDRQRIAAEVAGFEQAHAELATLLPRIEPIAALTAERATLDALAQNEGRRQTLAETLKAAEEETMKLAERRKALETAPQLEKEITAARDAKRGEVIALESALLIARTEWVSAKQDAETKRESLRSQYADIRKHLDDIVTAGDSGKCPTCQRPLEEHFRGVLDELNDQLELVKIDGNFYKQRVEQLSSVPAEIVEMEQRGRQVSAEAEVLERKLAKVQAGVTELGELTKTLTRYEQRAAEYRADLGKLATGYDVDRHTAVRHALESLTPLAQRASRLAALTERSDAARGELAAATQALDAAIARTTVLRDAVAGSAAQEVAWREMQQAHARATAALHESELAVARADADATAAADALARAEAARAELARAEERLTKLTRERRLHDELDHTYTDLRTDLNFALRPEISRLASEFLSELTDGRYTELDLDDEYNIVIVEDGAPKPVISGGEEDIANLVIRLAISQMIAERTGQVFSLLVLDEIFGSLDDRRRQKVIELLGGLNDRFEQVILITHIESLRWERFDRVLSVRLDPGTGASVVEDISGQAAPEDVLVGAEL
jgi:exonuclease SbcC